MSDALSDGAESPRILVPFDVREAISLREAARLAGKSKGTVMKWCLDHFIGRRVAKGPYMVSKVALAMFLDGDGPARRAYLAGDRVGPLVAPYFTRLGLAGVFAPRK
jgi:hypothetical protein